MINMMYLVLTALLALNVSSEILNAFKVVDRSLQKSSNNISGANEVLYKSLKEKLTDPQQGANAKIWQPIAEQAQKISKEMYEDIDKYKMALKEEAGGKPSLTDSTFKEDNLDAGTRYFDKKGKGKELFDKLISYRKAMLALNPEIAAQFDKTLQINLDENNDGTFTRKNFYMSPTIANLTMLSKFQNDVKNSENQVVTYCHSKLGQVKVQFDTYASLVGQSSEYIMPGEKIKIRAGVGAFSTSSRPTISINGQSVGINADGVAELEVDGGGSGPKTATVNISYTTQSGETKNETKQVSWVVGTPGGASVSADKMNVFYIGVENPVSIASGAGWDKTTVGWGGLSANGSNGRYTVTPGSGSEGIVNITVTSNNKTSTFPFRVKRLPPATAGIGPNLQQDGAMASASFRAMGGIRAALLNSDFNANYTVESYTITGAGAGFNPSASAQNNGGFWSGPAAAIANKAIPGSFMIFSNIVVKGPDGRPVKAANSTVAIKCI
jgi:gliding motility-associated protein GldM